MTILPLTYLGGIEWFAHLLAGGCVIDIGENWVKQTARNRCEILTSVGVAALTVPVHGYGAKIPTKDIRIDNSKRWQHQHWVSMVSAYRNSPFFDHYEGLFAPVYEKKLNYLADLNLELLNILTGLLDAGDAVKISETYVTAAPGDIDLMGKKALRREPPRPSGTPPREGNTTPPLAVGVPTGYPSTGGEGLSRPETLLKYTQVFSDRTEFVPGLSIIDLLFCESGRVARRMLSNSCPR